MSDKPIVQFKDLRLYFKFQEESASNYFYASASQAVRFDPTEFYKKSSEKTNPDFERSRRESLKSPKNNLGLMKVIDGVNLSIPEGKNMSIIGESGCGKTTLLLSMLNFPRPELKYYSGQILYDSPEGPVDILSLPEDHMRRLRGLHFGLIPQLGKSSMNPWLQVGFQTGEILKERLSNSQMIIKSKIMEYLGKVAFPQPGIKSKKYIHQLSGGEAQKVILAMALIANPRILLADEIFSGVDVISQSQIIDLLKELNKELPFQIIFTTHNLAAAFNLTELIAVMYAGELVEITTAKKFMDEPLHPYSQGLLSALPWYAMRKGIELQGIDGELPNAYVWPTGCRFSPRCSKVMPRCKQEKPPVFLIDDERQVACWLYSDE